MFSLNESICEQTKKKIDNYFFILFSLIPVSIIFGPAVSLINILLIDVSFIFFLIFTKKYKFLSNNTVKIILILCIYLIFNSIISESFSKGALRNFGFIRFGILFCAFNYFFYYNEYFNKILILWGFTLLILVIDVYFEGITGSNILGYGEQYGGRIVSFFEDEPIAGGYINAFYLIIVGYLFSMNSKFSKNYKYLILIVSLFFLAAIILTGERSNTIKAILGFFIFYLINDQFKIKEKLISTLLLFVLLTSLVNSSDFLKIRYKGQLLDPVLTLYKSETKEITDKKSSGLSIYLKLYQSGYRMSKSYPFFGVGNKNYGLRACEEFKKYKCNTHPHQIYFEFLAEHGYIGTIILLFILFNLIFAKLKIILRSKNYIQVSCLVFLLVSFIPLLPSGAFFSDYSLTIFWLNLSLMYSISKKTNIFSKN